MEMVKEFLSERMGFEGWYLLLAEPVAQTLGEVNSQKIAEFEEAILRPVDGLNEVIASMGIQSVGVFMRQMGYKWTRNLLLKAADQIK